MHDLEQKTNELYKARDIQLQTNQQMDARYKGYYDSMEDRISIEYSKINLIMVITGICTSILLLVIPPVYTKHLATKAEAKNSEIV